MLKHTLSTISRKPVLAKSPDCQLIYLWCIRVGDRGRVKISHQSITSILTWDEAVSVSTHSTLSAWLHKRWDPSCRETTDSWNGRQILMVKRYHLDYPNWLGLLIFMRLKELPIFKIAVCPSNSTEINQVGFEVTGRRKRGCIITGCWSCEEDNSNLTKLVLTSFGYVKLLCEELRFNTGSVGRWCTVIAFLSLPLFIRLKILNGSKIASGSWSKDPACLFVEDVGSSHKDLLSL